MNLYFCFLGKLWSMLAIHQTISMFTHEAAPAPKHLGQGTGGTQGGEGTRISLIPQHSSAATPHPVSQKIELKKNHSQSSQVAADFTTSPTHQIQQLKTQGNTQHQQQFCTAHSPTPPPGSLHRATYLDETFDFFVRQSKTQKP